MNSGECDTAEVEGTEYTLSNLRFVYYSVHTPTCQ